MAEDAGVDAYLVKVAALLGGSHRTRTRLLDELRDHLDDAIRAHRAQGVSEQQAASEALARLGAPEAVAHAWARRCTRLRRRQRARAAVLVATAAAASLLALAQHADGRPHPALPPPSHCLPRQRCN